jgi:hypothetical protein
MSTLQDVRTAFANARKAATSQPPRTSPLLLELMLSPEERAERREAARAREWADLGRLTVQWLRSKK